jgi:hypothetical protein
MSGLVLIGVGWVVAVGVVLVFFGGVWDFE